MFGIGDKGLFGVDTLVKPVIWDRLKQDRSMNPTVGTEGAFGMRQGGGAPQVGTVRPAPKRFNGDTDVVDLPSGVKATFSGWQGKDGRKNVAVDFMPSKPKDPTDLYEMIGGKTAQPSTKQAIGRLGEVYQALKSYVAEVRPNVITWEAGGSNLARVYERVGPLMAKELGGIFKKGNYDNYTIEFPGVK